MNEAVFPQQLEELVQLDNPMYVRKQDFGFLIFFLLSSYIRLLYAFCVGTAKK